VTQLYYSITREEYFARLEYQATTTSAREFAEAGKLAEWIHLFLDGEGNNQPMSDGLKLAERRYHAPKLYKIDTFERICGPEAEMKWTIAENGFNERVSKIMSRYQTGDWDMPPLIVGLSDGKYELNDGNHRYEALKRLGIKEHWVIIWKTIK